MTQIWKHSWAAILTSLLTLVGIFWMPSGVQAQVTVNKDVTVTAIVYGPPPTTQAVILQPADGQTLKTTLLVVQGTCGADLLVRVFNNGNLAGTITCSPDNTFTMNITLVVGNNKLTAQNYDAQEQPGPDSPAVNVIVLPPPFPPEEEVPSESPRSPSPDSTQDSEIDFANQPGDASNQRPSKKTPLFEGTFLEPITKLFGFEILVDATIKIILDVILRIIFIAVIVASIIWGSCLFWLRHSRRKK